MAFTAKILSWRFRHLNIVGCLLNRRPTTPLLQQNIYVMSTKKQV